MLVISDASPLNVLIRIHLVDLLPKLYDTIVIPPEVASELNDVGAPDIIREFMSRPPFWLSIQAPKSIIDLPSIGSGERAAISLAWERKADLLLIDDKRGRHAAQRLNLRIVGTIGLLETAAAEGLIDLRAAFGAIRSTDFSASDQLLEAALKRHAENENK